MFFKNLSSTRNMRISRKIKNAHFVPSLDGERGILILGLNDITDPRRDQAFEAQIIIHQYTHGMTYRLAASSDRMRSKKKRNNRKGSIFMALAISEKDIQNRSFTFNEWQDPETRSLPYSTHSLENDYAFSSLRNITYWEAHYIVEV
ncbi:hypothetical protein VSDG_01293 [Cytospora chrysosperma]|uniref:Extracellular metalloproteinase n=1 Tax=Cytospora chrysosperma TaxID=252740 RepID=A0A423WJ79_CYTCH|nr:hypothetical protein VSDG_01293 [Valsa sordida]